MEILKYIVEHAPDIVGLCIGVAISTYVIVAAFRGEL